MQIITVKLSPETLNEIHRFYGTSQKGIEVPVIEDILNRYCNTNHFDPDLFNDSPKEETMIDFLEAQILEGLLDIFKENGFGYELLNQQELIDTLNDKDFTIDPFILGELNASSLAYFTLTNKEHKYDPLIELLKAY